MSNNVDAEVFEQARSMHQEGRLQDADQLYRQILARGPHFEALLYLGALQLQAGQTGDAVRLLKEALALDPVSPEAHANLASAFQASGQHQEAIDHYEKALASRPTFLDARYALATTLQGSKRPVDAIAEFEKLLTAAPDHVEAIYGLATCLQSLGRHGDAIEQYEKAIAIDPDFAEAHYGLATMLQGIGRHVEAIASYSNALSIDPDYSEARFGMGVALRTIGRDSEAMACFDVALRASARDPKQRAKIHHNRGLVLHRLRRFEEALAEYEAAISIDPPYPDARLSLGVTLHTLGRYAEAITHFEQAASAGAGTVDTQSNIGAALQGLERHHDAIQYFERALAEQPLHTAARNNLGTSLGSLGRYHEAIDQFKQVLAIEPGNSLAAANIGSALEVLGQLPEASAAFEKAIDLAPTDLRNYLNLFSSRRVKAGDRHLATLQRVEPRASGFTAEEQITLQFALAKAYSDLGESDRSFQHLLKGNSLKRQQIAYSERGAVGLLETMERGFTRDLLHTRHEGGNPSNTPIFIVGMPRSGSTLVEQILASHRSVFGADERPDFPMTIREIWGETFSIDPRHIPSNDVRRLGSMYLARLTKLAPSAEHITDKMLGNFSFVGLIHLALPNARIIHSYRNPIDTCLSCFSKLFTGDQPFTYDLGELGRYYHAYEALMRHWRSALPEGVLLDVRYEDVVDDLEGQTRRVLEHCGLEWDDACLAFHETKRPVKTASLSQVRQPIYRSSVGRWRPSDDILRPLLDGIGLKTAALER